MKEFSVKIDNLLTGGLRYSQSTYNVASYFLLRAGGCLYVPLMKTWDWIIRILKNIFTSFITKSYSSIVSLTLNKFNPCMCKRQVLFSSFCSLSYLVRGHTTSRAKLGAVLRNLVLPRRW
jgi:hypothetical protein